MKVLKLLVATVFFLPINALPANASTHIPKYGLHCDFYGDAVKIAEQTTPPKTQAGDSTLSVELPLEGKGFERDPIFYSTGVDYFVRFQIGDFTLSTYLHSSGYGFPSRKTVGFSLSPVDGHTTTLFTADFSDQGYVFLEGKLLTALGVKGLENSAITLRVSCNDYGG